MTPASEISSEFPIEFPTAFPTDSATGASSASSTSADGAVRGAVRTRSSRRLVAALACALALSTGLGACSITLDRAGGGSTDSTDSPSASSESAGSSSSATPTNGSASQDPSPSSSPTVLPPLVGDGATGTASPDPERPGAGATITSDDWFSADQRSTRKTMTPVNGQVVVDRSYDTIHIEGDVTNLTINGSGVTVLVDYAENVVINDGSSNHVYVRDTKNVTVTSSYNTVLWAGNTPQIQDLGNGNTIKNQTEDKR